MKKQETPLRRGFLCLSSKKCHVVPSDADSAHVRGRASPPAENRRKLGVQVGVSARRVAKKMGVQPMAAETRKLTALAIKAAKPGKIL